jgi:hypothetical protein
VRTTKKQKKQQRRRRRKDEAGEGRGGEERQARGKIETESGGVYKLVI